MPEVDLKIGGRSYLVACQDGEELHLQSAASALNTEAEHVVKASGGRLPESRVLLMAGLMLADRLAGIQDIGAPTGGDLAANDEQIKALEAQIVDLKTSNAALEAMSKSLETDLQAAQSDDGAIQAGGAAITLLENVARELEAVADQAEGATVA